MNRKRSRDLKVDDKDEPSGGDDSDKGEEQEEKPVVLLWMKNGHICSFCKTYCSISGVGRKYKCPFCPLKLRNDWRFELHLSVEHPGENMALPSGNCEKGDCECISCGKENLNDLEKSYRRRCIIECPLCPEYFETAKQLKVHSEVHKTENVYSSDSESDSEEKKRPTTETKKFKCSFFCQKSFITATELRKHERIHSAERPYICNECGKAFSQTSNLNRHKRCVHGGVKPYQCHLCDKRFAEKIMMNSHIKTHERERPFICEMCKKGYTSSRGLKRHKKRHTVGDLFVCDICERGYPLQISLTKHRKVHESVKRRSLICNDCGKSYLHVGHLNKHKRIVHEGDKRYECHLCDKRFGEKTDLTNHIPTHSRRLLSVKFAKKDLQALVV